MTILLHQRLIASQTAPAAVVDLDRAIEAAVIDLRRIERGIVWAGKTGKSSDFTRKRVQAVASRLLQAAIAPEIELALTSSVDLPADVERGE